MTARLTAAQRADRNRLAQQLNDLARTHIPAAAVIALYDHQRRGNPLLLATNDHELDQAAALLERADRHATIIIRATDRRRLLRRLHLQPLGHKATPPRRLHQLADTVRYKRLAGTGHATILTIGHLVIIDARADHSRHVARRTREGLDQARARGTRLGRPPRNDHAPTPRNSGSRAAGHDRSRARVSVSG